MRTILFVVVVSCWLATPQDISACSCAAPPPPLAELTRADVVFTGTVIQIDEQPLEVGEEGNKFEIPLFLTKFEVDQSWKGVDGEEITIRTEDSAAGCGYPFVLGEDYLVYGFLWVLPFAGDDEEKYLQASICSRTKSLSEAQEEITILDGGTAVTPSRWGQIKTLFRGP